MARTHARTATIVPLVLSLLVIAVPASAVQSVERPIHETLSGHTVGIEYAPNFRSRVTRSTAGAVCRCNGSARARVVA
jgi:hypothetical protein